ncbi:hypothetical protein ERX27_00975 [Macrococcus brunensis]|uniref:DUF3278 domain-containing protein n=1 Tax=Macrococcus brunensis TaxID=198483 RepID=A0A4R6BGT7_9STAP|nr:hypothetical protein [Macrococcus brunensis]TDL99048.1 hypothetical protein ERX27_00975 [Macrococcus brunensis]
MTRFEQWYYKYMIGIEGVNDEREQELARQVLAKYAVLMDSLMLILLFASLITDMIYDRMSFVTLLMLVIVLGSQFYLKRLIRINQLDKIYAYNDKEYLKLIRQAKIRSYIDFTIYVISLLIIFMASTYFRTKGQTVFSEEVVPALIGSCIGMFIAGKNKYTKNIIRDFNN